MKTTKRILAGLLAITLIGCSSQTTNEEPEQTEEEVTQEALSVGEMTFTYVTSPLNVPSIVEKNLHVFEDTFGGAKVSYAEITSGADQTQALASGDVQVLYAVGGTSVILSAANGADIKVLNMYSRAPKAFCLFTKDEAINSPEDLRGKSIAGPTGTNLHELLVSYLASGGMTIDDVDYVNMSIPDARAALEGDSIDVAMLGGAAAYNCEKDGYHKITDGDGYIQAIICVAVTQKFYDEHPDAIAKLEEAQKIITEYMATNKANAIEMTATELDIDVSGVEGMYEFYDFSTEITGADKEGFQKTADFMFESGMIEEAFDVSALFLQ